MAPKSRVSLSTAPRPPVSLAPSIIISDTTALAGTYPIRIGAHTALHPKVKLNSTLGPITIGSHCVISERAVLTAPDEGGLTIEDGVVIEVNAVIEARFIGENSGIEVGVKVGKRAVIGKNCKCTPLVVVADEEVLEEGTVVYGYGEKRKDGSGCMEARRAGTEVQVEGLRGLLSSNRAKFMA